MYFFRKAQNWTYETTFSHKFETKTSFPLCSTIWEHNVYLKKKYLHILVNGVWSDFKGVGVKDMNRYELGEKDKRNFMD